MKEHQPAYLVLSMWREQYDVEYNSIVGGEYIYDIVCNSCGEVHFTGNKAQCDIWLNPVLWSQFSMLN